MTQKSGETVQRGPVEVYRAVVAICLVDARDDTNLFKSKRSPNALHILVVYLLCEWIPPSEPDYFHRAATVPYLGTAFLPFEWSPPMVGARGPTTKNQFAANARAFGFIGDVFYFPRKLGTHVARARDDMTGNVLV